MKFTLIYSASNFFLYSGIFMAVCSSAVSSCNRPIPIQKQQEEVKAIVQQVFSAKGLKRFIIMPNPPRFTFRYEELPMYNGHNLPKPTFNITLSNKEIVTYTISNREESNAVPIVIERVIINHDSASVDLRIPMQAVNGEFRLGKTAAGSWVVTKDYVAQE